MTDDNVTHLPEPGVVLDLDAEQRPAKDVKPPFIVKVGGRKVTFKDPGEIDWKDLAGVQIPADLFSVALERDDRNHIRDTPMESWRFAKLMESYYNHYDFDEKIRQAKRQAAFGA
jgi:hypothetical protein